MTKHKRWSDKPKSEKPSMGEEIHKTEQETSVQKEPSDIKSKILSFSKYVYIAAIASLLSGVFPPLTLGVEVENVIFGILTLFLGLGGGVLIYLGATSDKFSTLMICAGLATITASLIIIYELAENSLFV